MDYGPTLRQVIDTTYAKTHAEDGMRAHLGASIIGRTCMREIWFSFRWADSEELEGRMLRLFSRGHNEEERIAGLLRSVGATVWTEDANGKQFRVAFLGGHYGGDTDGVAVGLPFLPPEIPKGAAVLLEMKTHNDKRFKELKRKGLLASHPKHYAQAQVYMHGLDIKYCLYCAVNKNDDDLWFYLFEYDPATAYHLEQRAEAIIFNEGMPPRIADRPGWYECQFCAMSGVCFGFKTARQNCRTCVYSKPERDGTWTCGLNQPQIRTDPKVGCAYHAYLPGLERAH